MKIRIMRSEIYGKKSIQTAALYSRVSKDNAWDKPGTRVQDTENQLIELRDYCARQGWTIFRHSARRDPPPDRHDPAALWRTTTVDCASASASAAASRVRAATFWGVDDAHNIREVESVICF